MDETEFRRLLNLFPVVRSRSYCQAEAASSGGTGAASSGGAASFRGTASFRETPSFRATTSSITEEKTRDVQTVGKSDAEDPFWQKLKTAAETKVGSNKAEQFVQAFRDAHEKLVYKKLSIDVARSFIDTARK
ncbi:octanoyltransferase [Carex rostrata]